MSVQTDTNIFIPNCTIKKTSQPNKIDIFDHMPRAAAYLLNDS